MPFIDYIIDVVRNGTSIQQKINVEPDLTDATKISPARAIQVNGKVLAADNPLPVNGSVNVGNFPATQPVSGTVTVSNALALDTTAIAIRDRLPTTVGAKTAAQSFPVTLSTDGAFASAFGANNSVAATTDTASTGFMSLFMRLLSVKLPAALSAGGRFLTDSVIRTSATNPLQTNSMGLGATGVIKASPGALYSISCMNLNAATRYLQLFNKATAPTGTDTPVESFPVYANSGSLILGQEYFTLNGLDFPTGISFGMSTTATTFTAATAAETIFSARYL